MDEPPQDIKHCLTKNISISTIWDWQMWHAQVQQASDKEPVERPPPEVTQPFWTPWSQEGRGLLTLAGLWAWKWADSWGSSASSGGWFQPGRPVKCPDLTNNMPSLAPKLAFRWFRLTTRKLGLPLHLPCALMSEGETRKVPASLLPTKPNTIN